MVWSPMSDWREQNALSQRLFEHTQKALETAMQRGCEDWPLPEPPLLSLIHISEPTRPERIGV